MSGFNIIAGLRLNTGAFTSSLRGASVAVNNFSANSSKGMKGLQLSSAAAGVAIIAVVAALKSALNTMLEFSKATSELKAVLGGTQSEMKSLSQQAQELGASTVHTATQVVKLQIALARLGYSTDEILDMTKAILDLGTAMGISLQDSANLVGASLKAFNKDAKNATHFANVLAKATTLSALSFDKLKIAMPYAATSANQAGVSFERTAAMLGVMANKGLRASTMGTSLRRIFIRLSQKGLTFSEAMDKINNSTDKLSTSTNLFGVTAANAGIILAESTTEIDKYDVALQNSIGTTNEMAKIMADNLSGDITKVTSAWQGLVIAIDEGNGVMSTSLRYVMQKFADLLNILRSYANEDFNFFDAGAQEQFGSKNTQSLLNKKKLDITSGYTSANSAITEMNKLLAENKSMQEQITKLEERKLANVIPSLAEAKGKEIVALKLNILTNNALIKTHRDSIIANDSNIKSTLDLVAAQEAASKAAADALKLDEDIVKKREEAIKTANKLLDKYYLISIANNAALRDKETIVIWYKNEKAAIDSLNVSLEKQKELTNALNNARDAKNDKLMYADIDKQVSAFWDKENRAIGTRTGNINAGILPKDTNVELKTMNDYLMNSINLASQLASAFDLLGNAIADSIEGQDQVFANVTVGILKSINKIINALLAEMVIGVAAKEGSSKGIIGLAAAAIALPIAIGGLQAMINKNENKQNFAQGGIIGGTSFSGDKLVIGANSKEMVLTEGQQAELFALANGKGGVSGGQVEFEIRGDKLVGVLNNYNRKMSKIR